jgi:hypothetical protein
LPNASSTFPNASSTFQNSWRSVGLLNYLHNNVCKIISGGTSTGRWQQSCHPLNFNLQVVTLRWHEWQQFLPNLVLWVNLLNNPHPLQTSRFYVSNFPNTIEISFVCQMIN